MKEEMKSEYLEKTTHNKHQKMPHTKARKFKPQQKENILQSSHVSAGLLKKVSEEIWLMYTAHLWYDRIV